MALSTSGATVAGAFTVNVAFTEDGSSNAAAVTGLTLSDFSVTNGLASNLTGSDASYSFTVTPSLGQNGVMGIGLPADSANDSSSNGNNESNSLSINYDAPPSVTVTSQQGVQPTNGDLDFDIEFSEDVTGFDAQDITVTNGAVSNLVTHSAKSFSAKVTPAADGQVSVMVRSNAATDSFGSGNAASSAENAMSDNTKPTVTITGPSGNVTTAFDVTITFSESVTGFTQSDVTVHGGTVMGFNAVSAGLIYSLTIEPELGLIVEVSVAANAAQDNAQNGNADSNVFSVQAGSPASEFEKHKKEVENQIIDKTQRELNVKLQGNRNLVNDAKSRFVQRRLNRGTQTGPQNGLSASDFASRYAADPAPSHVNGSINAIDNAISANGTFKGAPVAMGGFTRYVFGDFTAQIDDDGSFTGAVSSKLAMEKDLTEKVMVGYFVGLDASHSEIKGSFDGNSSSVGLSLGGYLVGQLGEKLFGDAYISGSLDRTELSMDNGTLGLTSTYFNPSVTAGGSLTGIFDAGRFQVRPTLYVNGGWSHLGNINFTGKAYGLVDDTLSLDAGDIFLGNVKLSPEFLVPLGEDALSDDPFLDLSLAPRVMCEFIDSNKGRDQQCGGGAEVGLSRSVHNGATNFNASVALDKIQSTTRTTLKFGLEHKF